MKYSVLITSAALILSGCSDEIVVESEKGRALTSSKFVLSRGGEPVGKEISVAEGTSATVDAEHAIWARGRTFVAGPKGGEVSIQDGDLVLRGMKEQK